MCSLIVVSLTPNQINFNQFLKWKNHTWKLPKTFNYKWEGFCTLGDKDKIAKVLSRTIKISSPWTTGPVFLYLISYFRSYVFIDLNWFLRWAMWPMGLLFILGFALVPSMTSDIFSNSVRISIQKRNKKNLWLFLWLWSVTYWQHSRNCVDFHRILEWNVLLWHILHILVRLCTFWGFAMLHINIHA